MPKAEIIAHKFWRNKEDGRTASIHGSLPWVASADAAKWILVTAGYTIRWPDGTTGTGRKPFTTREAAEAYLAKNTKFGGWNAVTM